MFRNPRENGSNSSNATLTPSVGRPPSPPPSPLLLHGTTHQLNPTMTTKVEAPSPLSTNSVQPRPRTRSGMSASVKNGRLKTNPNGSILSFFKKAVPGESNYNSSYDSLFIDECQPASKARLEPLLQPSRSFEREDEDVSYEPLENITHPSKRRKRTASSVQSVTSLSLCEEISPEKRRTFSRPPPEFASEENGQPTPADSDDSQYTASKARPAKGPFIDDSDSDEELPILREARPDGWTPQSENPRRPCLDENTPLEDGRIWPLEAAEEEPGDEPPARNQEATSMAEEDGFDDFGDMEDFEEYVEGEEFTERLYMKEQRMLELAEAGIEDHIEEGDFGNLVTAFKQEENGWTAPSQDIGYTASACCPVCNASFEGVSDQEASVHVNHCLDGNPTPLPTNKANSDAENQGKADARQDGSSKFRQLARPAKAGQESPFVLSGTDRGGSSAFSKIMSGHAEDEAWASAAAAEHAARGKPAYQRTCPFYKILPGFSICVDAFRYGAVEGCEAYFLSHFHSDHYVGLTASWCHGPIYCSRPTANLIRQQLRVDPKWVVDVEFEKNTEVPGTHGVHVTMIPANHCPGSSIFLFEKTLGKGKNPKVQRVLHCGDFRACPAHVEHPLLRPDVMDAVTGKTAQQKIDVCYLDTTYLNPKYAFPSQEDVIKACADMCVSLNKVKPDDNDSWERMKRERAGIGMAKFVNKDTPAASVKQDVDAAESPTSSSSTKAKLRGRLLVIVGTYSIGKERICLGIARALNSLIYAPPAKQRICAALEDPELTSRLTTDPRAAQVHMTPLFEIRAETLADYLTEYADTFARAVGFRPSGWNYRPPGSRFTDAPAVSTVLHSGNWKSGYAMRDLVPQRGSTSNASCFGVPYSEHSSFRELTMFCCALRIDRIIPTVNVGSRASREKMKAWCERWVLEKKKNGLFKVRERDETGEEGRGNWYAGEGTWELRTTL